MRCTQNAQHRVRVVLLRVLERVRISRSRGLVARARMCARSPASHLFVGVRQVHADDSAERDSGSSRADQLE